MKESPQIKRTLLGTDVSVQTVRLLPDERAHLEQLKKTAEKKHPGRKVPFNEIMVRGLMGLKRI